MIKERNKQNVIPLYNVFILILLFNNFFVLTVSIGYVKIQLIIPAIPPDINV